MYSANFICFLVVVFFTNKKGIESIVALKHFLGDFGCVWMLLLWLQQLLVEMLLPWLLLVLALVLLVLPLIMAVIVTMTVAVVELKLTC